MAGDDDAADAWWRSLPPERRAQIYRWVTQEAGHPDVPGQMRIPLDEEGEMTDDYSAD